ncbi:hypothetical protein GQR58_026058 [Nymphon striatum]|nr:hypothetical protein GQR58_026058 [Nymphon striatum]
MHAIKPRLCDKGLYCIAQDVSIVPELPVSLDYLLQEDNIERCCWGDGTRCEMELLIMIFYIPTRLARACFVHNRYFRPEGPSSFNIFKRILKSTTPLWTETSHA